MGRAQNYGPDLPRFNHVTITTEPTLIVDKNSGRCRVIVVLLADGEDLWLGDETVTPDTGQLVVEGRGNAYTTEYTGPLYGVVASGTLDVSYFSEDWF